jgi:hypothetical protein
MQQTEQHILLLDPTIDSGIGAIGPIFTAVVAYAVVGEQMTLPIAVGTAAAVDHAGHLLEGCFQRLLFGSASRDGAGSRWNRNVGKRQGWCERPWFRMMSRFSLEICTFP